MEMKHVRYMGVLRVTSCGRPATLIFSRAFLADQFKGYCQVKKKKAFPSNAESVLPQNANNHSAKGRGDVAQFPPCRSEQTSQRSSNSTTTHAKPGKQASKYYNSVAYTLAVLSKESSSSSSSVDEIPEIDTFDKKLPCRSIQTSDEKQTPPPALVDSDLTDSSDESSLVEKLRLLGLPTSFGPVKRNRPNSKSNQWFDVPSDENIDRDLLILARSLSRVAVSPDLLKRTCSCDSLQASCEPLKPWSSSADLFGYHRAIFETFCYLVEVCCTFKQDRTSCLGDFSFDLPIAWQTPDFNLEAFLYECKNHWQYEVPRTAVNGGTVADRSSSLNSCDNWESDPLLAKYWAQRFRLFSLFNDGIQMDRDGFFSATPETIAAHQARRILKAHSQPADSLTVIDACSGAGSNSIQLALMGFNVIAVELDPVRLKMSVNNAKIYGVQSKIEFVCRDFFEWALEILAERVKSPSTSPKFAALFMSPPWGGPQYLNRPVFDLNSIQFGTDSSRDFWSAIRLASHLVSGNLVLFLPRNTNIAQLAYLSECVYSTDCLTQTAPRRERCIEIEMSVLNFKAKAISVYTGDLVHPVPFVIQSSE